MKSGVLTKNILVTLLGLCVMAVLGLVLMVANSDQDWTGAQPASTLAQSTGLAAGATPSNASSAFSTNSSGMNSSLDNVTNMSDTAGNSTRETALPEVSIAQKKQVLSQFFDAADTDIARIKKEISNAKSLGDTAQKIQEKEQRLQLMLDLRQKMVVQNASLL